MAEAHNDAAARLKKLKAGLKNKKSIQEVSNRINTDKWENKAQSLLQSGRAHRPAARPAKDGGAANIAGINFKENNYIADLTQLLDRVKVRQAFADWCASSFKPDDAAEAVDTDLIPPTKINALINEKLVLTFDKNLESYFGLKDYPRLLATFLRVVVGLMEKFYQKTEPDKHLKEKGVQFTLSCKMINCSEEGYVPEKFITDSEDIVISTNYVVSVGESPTLRIVYQDLHDEARPNIVHDINQDNLTLWYNDRFTHRIEAKGKGEAILLSIGLGNIEESEYPPVFED